MLCLIAAVPTLLQSSRHSSKETVIRMCPITLPPDVSTLAVEKKLFLMNFHSHHGSACFAFLCHFRISITGTSILALLIKVLPSLLHIITSFVTQKLFYYHFKLC